MALEWHRYGRITGMLDTKQIYFIECVKCAYSYFQFYGSYFCTFFCFYWVVIFAIPCAVKSLYECTCTLHSRNWQINVCKTLIVPNAIAMNYIIIFEYSYCIQNAFTPWEWDYNLHTHTIFSAIQSPNSTAISNINQFVLCTHK